MQMMAMDGNRTLRVLHFLMVLLLSAPVHALQGCTSDVLAYYHQDASPISGGKWKDLGPRGNDGTVEGSVSTSGHHVAFNGGSILTGIKMSDVIAASGGAGTYTVAAWFQYTGTDSQTYSAIFGGKDATGGTEWFIGKNSGNTALGVQDGNYRSNFVASPGIFDAAGRASAHSIIYTRSAASGGSYTGKVYIDGAFKASASFTGVNNQEELTIGKEFGGAYSFKGKIWQAIILKTEFSAAEAAILHGRLARNDLHCGAAVCPNSVVAYYNPGISPVNGGVIKDISARGNDGTISGGVSSSGDHLVFSSGSINTGLKMSDLITASGGGGAYTVAAWFQYTGTNSRTYSAIFGGKDTSGGTQWFVGKNSGNTALGVQDGNYISSFDPSPGIFDSAGRVSAHSIVFTRSAVSAGSYTGKVYIDGILKSTGSFSGVNGGEELHVGYEYEGGGYPFIGKIWQAIIMSAELSASQVSSLHGTLAAGKSYCPAQQPITGAANFNVPTGCIPHPSSVWIELPNMMDHWASCWLTQARLCVRMKLTVKY